LITIFVSVILFGLLVYLYLKERKTAGYKTPLVLRLVMLVLLVLILIGSIFKISFKQSPQIPLLVLVDASRSINFQGNLQKIDSIINKINQESWSKKIYTFTDSVKPWPDQFNPVGEKTDIAQALNFSRTRRPGAVILVSDGMHNQKNDPYAHARANKVPIYTVSVSSEQKKDLSVSSVLKPLQIFLSDTAQITVRLQNQGIENQPSRVSLIRKGKTVASQDILLTAPNTYQEVKFTIVPETTGKVSYSVLVDSVPDEENTLNNRKDFSLQVLKTRWQILYLTNSPSFNTRFLIASLEHQEIDQLQNIFNVVSIIAFTGRKYEIRAGTTIDQAFKNTDVVILDNVNEADLTPDLVNRLRNLLEQGKGFLILAGENFRAQTFIREILPLQSDAVKSINRDLFLELTEPGTKLPLFFNQANQYLLDNTPPLWGAIFSEKVKPDAAVWLHSKDDQTPLLSYHTYQQSKIVFASGFPLWRLGFSSIATETRKTHFDQFLTNLVRFLGVSDLDNFRLVTDKPDYLTGELMLINLLATTPDARPFTDLDVRVNIAGLKTDLPLYETRPGTYEIETEAAQSGQYQLTATVYKDTMRIGSAQTTINITEQTIEDITGLDADLMQKIAALSNGRYYSADQFLRQPFEPEFARYQKTINISITNNPYLYTIIVLLFGTLLYLRKKRGLL